MYEIMYGDRMLHKPLDEVFALDCTCKLSLAAPGELRFKLHPGHPLYGEIELLQKSVEIVLSDDGEELFRGRAMEKAVDFDGNEAYVCEGNLAYLNDILLRPYSTEDPGMPRDPAGYFTFLINSYNQYAAAKDVFAVGRNEANRIKPSIDRENSKMVSVRQELKDKMLDPLGGYAVMRHEGGRWWIDYLADGGKESAQRIEFGVNLTDYMRESSAYERYTAVVPVGSDADGNHVGIASLPDGIVFEGIRKEGDRLVDVEAAAQYGIIEYDLPSDAALPVNVQASGINFLRTNAMGDTLEIKAVDLHLVDPGIKRIGLGDYTRVLSDPHGVDGYFLCIERDLEVSEPEQDTFVLGTEQATLTSVQQARIAALNAGIDKTFEEAKGASQAAKDAAKDAADAMEEAGGKARIFTSQPVPPYSVGDLWSQGAGGDILKCERARSDGEEYQANDWMLASKYTDDALAELAKKAAEEAKNKADQAFDDAKDAADKATEAKNAADEATAKTEVIESQVTEVRESAKTAQDAADAAQATADDAKEKAGAAENAAGIAQGAAEAAQGSAKDAATSAGEAVSAANEAKKQIGDVAADAAKIRTDLEGEIASVSTAMQADYAKKTDLTATESKLLTQIEQSAAAIKLEAGQTYAKKTDLTDVETSLNAKIEVNASGIEQAVKESTTAKADASDAKAKADAAQAAAGTASSEAAEAASAASGAQSAADKAKADALAAQQRADEAKSAADKAKEDYDDLSIRADATDEQLAAAQEAVDAANKAAGTAQSAADAAKSAAGAAQSTADKAKADSATAKAAADAAKAKADEAAEAVAGVANRVTEAETKITQNANAITSVASRTTAVENKFGGYSTTEQMQSAINQKADSITQSVSKTYATQATVNAVKSTADAAKTGAATAQTTANTANNRATYRYGTCATAAATAAKAVSLAGFALFVGATVTVRFDAGNTAASPTLNVNGTGAKAVVINGSAAPSAALAAMAAYATATYTYDGTYWRMSGTDQATVDAVSAKSEIKQQADRIASNVAETTNLGKRMSTVEQTASGLSVRLDTTDKNVTTAQSTANTAKTNAAAAQTTANTANSTANAAKTNAATAQSTANTAKTNAATAQSTANTARTEAANAAKTATNYMEYSSAGLDVGNKSSGKWSGMRSRMAAGAFQVLDEGGSTTAELKKNAVTLCGGTITIAAQSGTTSEDSRLLFHGGSFAFDPAVTGGFSIGGSAVATLRTANGYRGMGASNADYSDWIRTTVNGFIPYQSGGASALGTSGWPFNSVYTNNMYVGGQRISDFVVASGTSGEWTYRKWNSGIAECWCSHYSATPINIGWGNGWCRSGFLNDLAFPFAFAAVPVVIRTPRTSSSSYAGDGNDIRSYTPATTTRTGLMFFARNGSNGDCRMYVDHYVVGRWK